MTVASEKRGWVEIYPTEAGTFDVFDWSEYHDSGYYVGAFDTRAEALKAAVEWGDLHNRKLVAAEVISLSDFRGEAG